jgi:hypothetical protein
MTIVNQLTRAKIMLRKEQNHYQSARESREKIDLTLNNIREKFTKEQEIIPTLIKLGSMSRQLLQDDLEVLLSRRRRIQSIKMAEGYKILVRLEKEYDHITPYSPQVALPTKSAEELLKEISNTNIVINTILNYPEDNVPLDLLKDVDSHEKNDVLINIEIHNQLRNLTRNMREYLQGLRDNVERTKLRRCYNESEKIVKYSPLTEADRPKHIVEINKHLKKLDESESPETIFSIFTAIKKILSSVGTSRLRQIETEAFYRTELKKINAVRLNKEEAIQPSAPPLNSLPPAASTLGVFSNNSRNASTQGAASSTANVRQFQLAK